MKREYNVLKGEGLRVLSFSLSRLTIVDHLIGGMENEQVSRSKGRAIDDVNRDT